MNLFIIARDRYTRSKDMEGTLAFISSFLATGFLFWCSDNADLLLRSALQLPHSYNLLSQLEIFSAFNAMSFVIGAIFVLGYSKSLPEALANLVALIALQFFICPLFTQSLLSGLSLLMNTPAVVASLSLPSVLMGLSTAVVMVPLVLSGVVMLSCLETGSAQCLWENTYGNLIGLFAFMVGEPLLQTSRAYQALASYFSPNINNNPPNNANLHPNPARDPHAHFGRGAQNNRMPQPPRPEGGPQLPEPPGGFGYVNPPHAAAELNQNEPGLAMQPEGFGEWVEEDEEQDRQFRYF